MPRTIALLAGVLGATGVIAGAFGAHGLEQRGVAPDLLDAYQTGAQYHIYHALAVLGCGWLASLGAPRRVMAAVICFTVGTVIFAGSLYLLALTGATWWGAVTPIGGTLLIVGWVLVVAAAFGLKPRQA